MPVPQMSGYGPFTAVHLTPVTFLDQLKCSFNVITTCLCTDYTNYMLTIIIVVFVHYTYIQGVTGGTDQTSGECSLGQTIPI